MKLHEPPVEYPRDKEICPECQGYACEVCDFTGFTDGCDFYGDEPGLWGVEE